MPRLTNVTEEELEMALDMAADLISTFASLEGRMEKGYCDDISKPFYHSNVLLALIRQTAALGTQLHVKMALQELKADIEVMMNAKLE